MHKAASLLILALFLVVGAVFFGLRRGESRPPVPVSQGEGGETGAAAPPLAPVSGMDTSSPASLGEEAPSPAVAGVVVSVRDWAEEESRDSEVQRMQEILDTNVDVDILAQAEFLVDSASEVRRHAAIAPLQWVNNPASLRLLGRLVQDPEPEIASEALDAIGGVLDTIATQVNTDENGELETAEELDLDEFFDSATETLLACPDQDSLDVLLFKISTLDVSLSLPIYLELLENGLDWQKESALEYMDNVTHGDGVTNREEAYLWLQQANGTQRVDP